MELIKPGTNFDFVGKMRKCLLASGILILLSLLLLLVKGPNYGIDFAGGTLLEFRFPRPLPIEQIRQALQKIGLGKSIIQAAGEGRDILIRVQETDQPLQELRHQIQETLKSELKEEFEVLRVDQVGPKAGTALRRQALLALIYATIGVLIYISWRFEFRFGIAAVLALVHDVIITVGIFTALNKEFTLTVIAALLTIAGYSLNDTIVVFDRIRENLRFRKREVYAGVINRSINETLSRTILTSGTTLLVVLALFFLGGPVIHDFAFVLLVGIITGTYSSIFVASPILVFWQVDVKTKLKPLITTGKR
ncbi:MAG: protein translocase subunit SecF [Nitrospinota bacterium]|nr:MAG: protein translocase subunit SecF [Nitrospinota bacterium]